MNRTISILLAACLSAGSASAVTITAQDMPFAGSTPLTLEMERTGGPRGDGKSVVGNTGQPVWKTDRNAPHAYGRYGIDGGPWLDSQDGTRFRATLLSERPTTTFDVFLTDAFDQRVNKALGGKSFFEIEARGASWEIPNRQKNATGHWVRIQTKNPVSRMILKIRTRMNDGFGLAVKSGKSC